MWDKAKASQNGRKMQSPRKLPCCTSKEALRAFRMGEIQREAYGVLLGLGEDTRPEVLMEARCCATRQSPIQGASYAELEGYMYKLLNC